MIFYPCQNLIIFYLFQNLIILCCLATSRMEKWCDWCRCWLSRQQESAFRFTYRFNILNPICEVTQINLNSNLCLGPPGHSSCSSRSCHRLCRCAVCFVLFWFVCQFVLPSHPIRLPSLLLLPSVMPCWALFWARISAGRHGKGRDCFWVSRQTKDWQTLVLSSKYYVFAIVIGICR